jgi:thiosulfate/3-mercaptopyruvate sulfurtransferase
MKQNISPIINVSELIKLSKLNNIVIVDASNGVNAKLNYETKHLNDALFIDLDTQLANIKENVANGGRHPLPSINQFSKTLQDLGISTQTHVIIYDDKNGANAAARFWWMLKAIGHVKVQVLNGGIQEAERMSFPINSNKVKAKKVTPYTINQWQLPTISLTAIEKNVKLKNSIIIDVRETARYKGEYEPIDLVAGHIPTAINIPFIENLTKDGLFVSPSELHTKYSKIINAFKNNGPIIVHCGSGVTACHTLLAFEYAGLKMPTLYVGSWSEWSRNNKPIEIN